MAFLRAAGRAKPIFTRTSPVLSRRFASSFDVTMTEDRIAVVSLNRPPVNAFDLSSFKEFTKLLNQLETDGVDAAVITSSKRDLFSAGLDLKTLVDIDEETFKEFWTEFEEFWGTLYSSSLITVAAVNGVCPALGCVIALSCDYRVMVNNPKYLIGLNETAIGMIPPPWLLDMAGATVGFRNAERLVQGGMLVNPEKALQFGLVDELCAEEELMEKAFQEIKLMRKANSQARAETKKLQRMSIVEMSGEDSVDFMADVVLGDDFQTAIKGIVEKMSKKK